jgi:prepilin signal peptidase PulO-like enzyme (type II secretory pathway)
VFSMGVLMTQGVRGRKTTFPFGPFLAAGAMVALLWGPQLWNAWYVGA